MTSPKFTQRTIEGKLVEGRGKLELERYDEFHGQETAKEYYQAMYSKKLWRIALKA